MSKKLVAYFSATNVTAEVANTLAEAAGADLYEIKAEVPYTTEDINWRDNQSRSYAEYKDSSIRPAITGKDANINEYDVIFLGFPIWWHVAPLIINTFLESYDFSNKIVVPFATSGSEGFGNTLDALTPSASINTIWKDGKMLNGNPSKEILTVWIDNLNL